MSRTVALAQNGALLIVVKAFARWIGGVHTYFIQEADKVVVWQALEIRTTCISIPVASLGDFKRKGEGISPFRWLGIAYRYYYF
jgi:hypothetical protein